MNEYYDEIPLPAGVELLPCPFCGSPAHLNQYINSLDDHVTKVVCCTNGGSDDDGIDECVMYLPSQVAYKATKREAIAIWNTRNGVTRK